MKKLAHCAHCLMTLVLSGELNIIENKKFNKNIYFLAITHFKRELIMTLLNKQTIEQTTTLKQKIMSGALAGVLMTSL
ncbi:MAG: hypothetical protein ACI8R1_002379, partial [Psychrobacter glaciei]